jgi:sugar phosphate isomerase/epimerase
MSASLRLTGIGDEAASGLGDQIAVHHELGWDGIELRTIEERPLAELSSHRREEAAAELAAAEIRVAALCSRIGNWERNVSTPIERDLEELEALAAWAEMVECRLVRIMSYPNAGLSDDSWGEEVIGRIVRLTALAEERGLTLVLENCSGWAGTSAERTLTLIEAVGSPALRVLFDVGNPVADGYDGVDYLERVLPCVEHVHVKDARRSGGEVRFTLPGEGEAELDRCLDLLFVAGYEGWLSIEPHLAHVIHEGWKGGSEELHRSYVDYARRFEAVLARVADGVQASR